MHEGKSKAARPEARRFAIQPAQGVYHQVLPGSSIQQESMRGIVSMSLTQAEKSMGRGMGRGTTQTGWCNVESLILVGTVTTSREGYVEQNQKTKVHQRYR